MVMCSIVVIFLDDDLRELAKLPTPFVLLDRYVEGIEERCVTFNHHHASRIAVEHLIAGGIKKNSLHRWSLSTPKQFVEKARLY